MRGDVQHSASRPRVCRREDVGDLYGLVCRHLGLELSPKEQPSLGHSCLVSGVQFRRHDPWTREDVYATLISVVVDQLQLQASDVHWWSRFVEDLGCD